jgi:hypothetical protein
MFIRHHSCEQVAVENALIFNMEDAWSMDDMQRLARSNVVLLMLLMLLMFLFFFFFFFIIHSEHDEENGVSGDDKSADVFPDYTEQVVVEVVDADVMMLMLSVGVVYDDDTLVILLRLSVDVHSSSLM